MTDLNRIQWATEKWWRWLLWCWRCRAVVELIAMDAEDAPKLRDKIHLLELDLMHEKLKNKMLEQKNGEHKEALHHVGEFIARSHRITSMPKPGTIQEILKNAQRS